MLPVPFKNFVPELYKKNVDLDQSAKALCDFLDLFLTELKNDILNLYNLKVPSRCPSWLLDEFGAFFAAGIIGGDSERTKRQKISSAITRHKNRGSWANDAKLMIDSICGGDSFLIRDYFFSQWILWGHETSDDTDYTSVFGKDGIDGNLGIDLVDNSEDFFETMGVVWIDVDNDSLTSEQVNYLVANLKDIVPCYFRVFLGTLIDNVYEVYYVLD